MPSSQDSVTRGVQNLHVSDPPAAQAALPAPTTVDNGEFKETAATETTAQRVPSVCAVRSRSRRSQSILRPRSHAAHGSKTRRTANCSQQALGNCAVSTVQPASFVALSNHNDATDAASVRAMPRSVNFVWGDTFQDRQPGHESTALGGAPTDQQPPQSSQPVPPGDPLDDKPATKLSHSGHYYHRTGQAGTRRASPGLRNGTPAMRGLSMSPLHGQKGAMSGHQSWVLLCRYRCRLLLAGSLKVSTGTRNLKLRLLLWEKWQISDLISKVLGQQNSGPLRRTARKMQPQTE